MVSKHLFLVLILTVTMGMFFGCSDDDGDDPQPVDEFALLTDAGDTYFGTYLTTEGESPNITISDLYNLLVDSDTTNDPYIIDFRSAADYAAGHINTAVNMTLGALPTEVDNLPTDKLIVNVCYTGQTASHATAFMNLIALDPEYDGLHARNLMWGMSGVGRGNPVTPYIPNWVNKTAADEFIGQLQTTANTTTQTYDLPAVDTGEETLADVLKARWTTYLTELGSGWAIKGADADVATAFANDGTYFVVNYWPEAQYLNPGHIPGAYCFVPKTSLLASADLNKLPLDKDILVYCYTGHTSAQVAAYLRLLGYKAWSLGYGVNGFARQAMVDAGFTSGIWNPPASDHSAILDLP